MNYNKLSEHLGRQTRYRLFMLIYRKVKENLDLERELLREEGKKVGRGRPGYLVKVAEFLGVSRETVFAWKRKRYQAMNLNADLLVRRAYSVDKEETVKILREDLESHRQKLEWFLKMERNIR